MSAAPPIKRQKMSASNGSSPIIGTHNGHFHADEALAVFLLRLLPEYASASLIRTRDPETLATCSIVVDVGGVHDHTAFRYDHHQREFSATFPGKHTKLSSAGLVWMHYGKRIVSVVTGLEVESPETELLYQKLYDDFVEAFDANDNGIAVYDPAALRAAKILKGLNDKGFSIASVVGRYNYGMSNLRPALSPFGLVSAVPLPPPTRIFTMKPNPAMRHGMSRREWEAQSRWSRPSALPFDSNYWRT